MKILFLKCLDSSSFFAELFKDQHKRIEIGDVLLYKLALITLLKIKFDKDFTKDFEDKIKQVNEDNINKLTGKFFEITLEDLKEILK